MRGPLEQAVETLRFGASVDYHADPAVPSGDRRGKPMRYMVPAPR